MLQKYPRNYIYTVVRATQHPAPTANVKLGLATRTAIRVATVHLHKWNFSNIRFLTIFDSGNKMAFNSEKPI